MHYYLRKGALSVLISFFLFYCLSFLSFQPVDSLDGAAAPGDGYFALCRCLLHDVPRPEPGCRPAFAV